MNRIVEGIIVFFGICLLLLVAIFFISATAANDVIGAVLLLIAFVMFYFVYRVEKVDAMKPTQIQQTFNVKMEGSGAMDAREMKCKSCGAPITDKDLTVIQGGIMAKCSFCGAVFALEEAPKW